MIIMAEWIKWWESKFFLTLFITILIVMGLCFVCAYFISWPWNLICVLVICLINGIYWRKRIPKEIEKWIENMK